MNKLDIDIMRPRKLELGDSIGFVSLSSPVSSRVPKRFERAIKNVQVMGFNIVLGENINASYYHTAGTIQQRINDFHLMYENPDIKAIISCIGGYNSNQLLDQIDYRLIKANPKILMGYSDFTSILLSVYRKTNQVTFMGPALLPQFGEYNGLHPFMSESIKTVLMSNKPIGRLANSYECIDEKLEWDFSDNRDRITKINSGPRIVKNGIGKGKIIAGNLGTLLSLCGTDFFPDLEGAILFIEESEDKNIGFIDRLLTQLRLINAFKKIKGLVFGRLPTSISISHQELDLTLLIATRDYSFPIIVDFDIGHTDPINILPIGLFVEIEALEDVKVTIPSNAVV